jgi:hypothetical protein
MKFIRLLFIPLFTVILIGCADENPVLVNPPDGTDSMMLRVINLAGDGNARQLSFGTNSVSAMTNYGTASPIFRAPIGDSATGIILNNGIEEQRTFRKLQFTRTNYHTYFILPGITAKRNKPADTLLYYTTQARRALVTRNPEIRLINCFPDSQYVFSLREGCQNGEELLRDNGYLSQSSSKEISVNNSLSLTLLRTNSITKQTDVLGLYALRIDEFSSYSFFTFRQQNGLTGLSVINDRDQTVNALQNLVEVPERKSFVKFLNLSKSSLSLKKIENNISIPMQDVASAAISESAEIGACKSSVVDSFAIENNGERVTLIEFPVQVQKNYIIVANDSSEKIGKYLAVLPQIMNTAIDPFSSKIYVINLIQQHTDLTFAVGSRTVQGNKQLSGEVLSSRLLYGAMSSPVSIPSGILPLTVFTTKQPAQLQSAFVGNLEGGKSYYLIAWSMFDGQTRVSLLPTDAENESLPLLDKGSFVSLVQANSAKGGVKFSVENTLSNLNVDFRSSTGTVVRKGSYQIFADDISYNLIINPDSNYTLYTYTSQSGNAAIAFSTPQGSTRYGEAKRRCVNLTQDQERLSVSEGASPTTGIIAENVFKNSFRDAAPVFVERRLLLTFWNGEKKLSEITGLLPLGRNYSLVIAGKEGSYYTIVQQEY